MKGNRMETGGRKPVTTATQVAAAASGVHSVTGANGLYLRKSETGAGSWFFRYRVGDMRREMGLGPAIGPRAVTLADAREKAHALGAQRRAGGDPIDDRRRDRIAAKARAREEAKKVTFAQATEAFVDEYAPGWKHRYARANWINPLRRYAYSAIGDILLDDIKVAHVRMVTDAAKKVPGIARRLRLQIASVLDDAAERGLRDEDAHNPADARRHRGLRRRAVAVKHFRRIELDAAPVTFRHIQELAANSSALSAWMFMIAAAVRPSEALHARWSEINLDKKLWTIPPARTKNGREHVVPLSSLALAALKRQATVRTSDAIFPGRGGSPLSYDAFARAPQKAGIDAGTPHSWRSVFCDACGDRLRVDRDLAEAALGHSLGAVEGAYRRETAIEARRPVMEAYARWFLGEGANVVSFPARA
jgi:integrase